jgi:hypothetical protein
MATIVTRAGKGAPLTNTELDQNFIELNDKKFEYNTFSTNGGGGIVAISYLYFLNELLPLGNDVTIQNPSGTPIPNQKILFRIRDNGSSRALTWDTAYYGAVAPLPSTTIAGKLLYLGFIYNSVTSKLDLLARQEEL